MAHALWGPTPSPVDGDSFYTPPSGYESAAPGTVLRTRTITPAIFMNIRALLLLQTYQLLYRTTDLDGKPMVATTTVFVPGLAKKDQLIAHDSYTDSAALKCAPSYGFQEGSHQNNILIQGNLEIIQAYLLLGYTVVASDNEGPDSAFAAGRLNGMISLDGVRAALSFSPSKLGKDTKIVGHGYSGGAIAAGWAASLASTYAKELNYVGWALGGMPADLAKFFINIDKTRTVGLFTGALAGLSAPSAYPQLGKLLDEKLTPKGRAAIDSAKKECAIENIRHMANQSVLSTDFSSLGAALLEDQTVADILDQNKMGMKAEETPQAPVFLYHSNVDGTVPYETATSLAKTWCANGAKVQFNTYTDSNHQTMFIRPLRDILNYIESAFDGTASKTCTEKTVAKTPFALPLALQPIYANLDDFMDRIYNGP
ncbi:hypothetical protein CBS101457_004970 [Exobasidium rhododendri]|nr:hypothetical protein CBS101457_004970 [Exobasidium rhododendri]